jgi:hypothetical protein
VSLVSVPARDFSADHMQRKPTPNEI